MGGDEVSEKKYDGGDVLPTGMISGISLRDWFAVQALRSFTPLRQYTLREVAKSAYEIADAMLAERSK